MVSEGKWVHILGLGKDTHCKPEKESAHCQPGKKCISTAGVGKRVQIENQGNGVPIVGRERS